MSRLALLLPLLVAVACQGARTDAGEVLEAPAALVGDAYVGAEPGVPVPADSWWLRFEDPVLDELVEAVLAGNYDLRLAAANVRAADARLRAATGRRGPTLDAAFTASRSLDNPPGAGRVYTTSLRPQLVIAWQADLFGRLAAGERARAAELFASEAGRVALAHALVAQAARLRVELSLLERERLLAEEVTASRARTLGIVERRYESGVSGTSAVQVHLARENLAAARAALPAIQRDSDQTRLVLDVLLGRKPTGSYDPGALGTPLPPAAAPPPGVPAALLDRRPDLIAARARVEAAAAEVDVSLAALYPDLTLSAAGGWSADELSDLFSADTLFANALAGLTAPLFASGRLEADVDAARASLDAAVAAYSGDVLEALREVEAALVAEAGLRAELVRRTEQRDEALRAEGLARSRYQRGLESLLTVLETERRRATSDDAVLRLQSAVWSARIDLHLALGGDWFQADMETPR